MPAMPPAVNTVRVVHHFSDGEDMNAINRIHFSFTGTRPTVADANTFANNCQGEWNAHLSPFLHSGLSVTKTDVTDLTDSMGASGEYVATNAGSRTGTGLSAGAAAIVKEIIARRYRGGHGRVYGPYGVAEDLNDPQTWTNAFANGLLSAFVAYAAAIRGAGWTGAGTLTSVIPSFFEGFTNVLYPSGRYHAKPTPRATALIQPVMAFDVNPKVGSQRRRNLQGS